MGDGDSIFIAMLLAVPVIRQRDHPCAQRALGSALDFEREGPSRLPN
jgi:hypothetical protein